MSVDVIIGQLVKRFEEEFAKWRDEVMARVDAEVREAAYSVLKEYEPRIRGLQDEISLERERLMYEALMEVKERKLKVLERELNRVVSAVFEEVRKLRGSERYRGFLLKALQECSEIAGKNVRIRCAALDRGLVEELTKELGLTAEIVEANDDMLGVVVESPDGVISVDATITSRLELVRERIKELIAHKLWGEYERA